MSLLTLPSDINSRFASFLGIPEYGYLQQTNSSTQRDCNSSEFILGIAEVLKSQLHLDNNHPFILEGGIEWIYGQLSRFRDNPKIIVCLLRCMVNLVYKNPTNRQKLLQQPIIHLIKDWMETQSSNSKEVSLSIVLLLSNLVVEQQVKMSLEQRVYSEVLKLAKRYGEDEKMKQYTLKVIRNSSSTRLRRQHSSKEIWLHVGGLQYAWDCLYGETGYFETHQCACMALWNLYHKSPQNQQHFIECLGSFKNLKLLVRRAYQYSNRADFIRASQALLHIINSSLVGNYPICGEISVYYKNVVSELCETQLQSVVQQACQQGSCRAQRHFLSITAPVILNLINEIKPVTYHNRHFLESLVSIFHNRLGTINVYNWTVGILELLLQRQDTSVILHQLGLREALYGVYSSILEESGNPELVYLIGNLLTQLQ